MQPYSSKLAIRQVDAEHLTGSGETKRRSSGKTGDDAG
jgi:hypothetical protein